MFILKSVIYTYQHYLLTAPTFSSCSRLTVLYYVPNFSTIASLYSLKIRRTAGNYWQIQWMKTYTSSLLIDSVEEIGLSTRELLYFYRSMTFQCIAFPSNNNLIFWDLKVSLESSFFTRLIKECDTVNNALLRGAFEKFWTLNYIS